jgi:5'-deoxynucleotidase YfbR-like HD superfamily hydrolase
MKHLTDLFKIMQLTRSQPQYGYVTAGIQQDELSNLAEHHYLVSFFAWQLARQLKSKGADIDVLRVVEFSLVHDVGELFGGDISSYYRKANPKALKYAKAFEEENQKFLSKFFGDDENHFKKLGHEILDFKSDEALVSKIADYIEIVHFKKYVKVFSKKFDIDFMKPKLKSFASNIKDPIAKRELNKFIKMWVKDILNKEVPEILLDSIKK